MKGLYVLMSFHGCVLSWLTTIHLDQGNDRSFDIYYYNFPMGTYLKHFINVYRCDCWMKSTSIDGLDGYRVYIRPWLQNLFVCFSCYFLVIMLPLVSFYSTERLQNMLVINSPCNFFIISTTTHTIYLIKSSQWRVFPKTNFSQKLTKSLKTTEFSYFRHAILL